MLGKELTLAPLAMLQGRSTLHCMKVLTVYLDVYSETTADEIPPAVLRNGRPSCLLAAKHSGVTILQCLKFLCFGMFFSKSIRGVGMRALATNLKSSLPLSSPANILRQRTLPHIDKLSKSVVNGATSKDFRGFRLKGSPSLTMNPFT